jgi:hypothetical protein
MSASFFAYLQEGPAACYSQQVMLTKKMSHLSQTLNRMERILPAAVLLLMESFPVTFREHSRSLGPPQGIRDP